MTDERLAEIRRANEDRSFEHHWCENAIDDLLAEVDRMRALEKPGGIEIDPAKVTPELIAEWQAAWDEMLAGGVAMYDLTPQPRDPDWWTPLRDRIPRSNDHPEGG
jgi:hypothetical protein